MPRANRCPPCRDGACEDCNWSDVAKTCCCGEPILLDPDSVYSTDELADSELADLYEAELDRALRQRPHR